MKILVIILLFIAAGFCYGDCNSFECQINAILNKYPTYNKEAMQELTTFAQQNSENLRIMQNMGPVAFYDRNYMPTNKTRTKQQEAQDNQQIMKRLANLGIGGTEAQNAAANVLASRATAQERQLIDLQEEELDYMQVKAQQEFDNAKYINKLRMLEALNTPALADIGYGSKGGYSMSPEERAAYVRKMTGDPLAQASAISEINALNSRLDADRDRQTAEYNLKRFKLAESRKVNTKKREDIAVALVTEFQNR